MLEVIGPVRVSIFSVHVSIFTHPVAVSYLYNEDKNMYMPAKENQTNAAPTVGRFSHQILPSDLELRARSRRFNQLLR